MATIRSLTVALGMDTGGLDKGADSAASAVAGVARRFRQQSATITAGDLSALQTNRFAVRDRIAWQDRLYAATHSSLQLQLRDHDQYFAAMRQKFRGQAGQLGLIEKVGAAERAKILEDSEVQLSGRMANRFMRGGMFGIVTGVAVGGVVKALEAATAVAALVQSPAWDKLTGTQKVFSVVKEIPLIKQVYDAAVGLVEQIKGETSMADKAKKIAEDREAIEKRITAFVQIRTALEERALPQAAGVGHAFLSAVRAYDGAARTVRAGYESGLADLAERGGSALDFSMIMDAASAASRANDAALHTALAAAPRAILRPAIEAGLSPVQVAVRQLDEAWQLADDHSAQAFARFQNFRGSIIEAATAAGELGRNLAKAQETQQAYLAISAAATDLMDEEHVLTGLYTAVQVAARKFERVGVGGTSLASFKEQYERTDLARYVAGMREQTKTPLDRYREDLGRDFAAFKQGLMGPDLLARSVKQARDTYAASFGAPTQSTLLQNSRMTVAGMNVGVNAGQQEANRLAQENLDAQNLSADLLRQILKKLGIVS